METKAKLRMTAPLRATPLSPPEEPIKETRRNGEASSLIAPARAYLTRLAALHDEAAETAYLANLLGRAPWVAATLGGIGLLAAYACVRAVPTSAVAVWLALLSVVVGTTAYIFLRADESPFDRDVLKLFVRNLSTTLLFAGLVWGAGTSLVLSAGAGALVAVAFVAGMAGAVAFLLRARDVSFCFLIPATAMGTICITMQSFDVRATLGMLAAGLAVAGLAIVGERLGSPRLSIDHG